MLIATTGSLQGYDITDYLGLVTGEAISGANFIRDIMANVRDFVGGRSAAYEEEVGKARDAAMTELTDRARMMGADAVVGVSLDYETIGPNGSMIMVTMAGTAVRLRKV